MGVFDVLSKVTGGSDEQAPATDAGEATDDTGGAAAGTGTDPADFEPTDFREAAEMLAGRSDVPELGFSEESLADLDAIATGNHPVDDPMVYGSYLGETLVREFDGEWAREDGWVVGVDLGDDHTTVAVFDAARMALERGPVFERVAERLHEQGDPHADSEPGGTRSVDDQEAKPEEGSAEPTDDATADSGDDTAPTAADDGGDVDVGDDGGDGDRGTDRGGDGDPTESTVTPSTVDDESSGPATTPLDAANEAGDVEADHAESGPAVDAEATTDDDANDDSLLEDSDEDGEDRPSTVDGTVDAGEASTPVDASDGPSDVSGQQATDPDGDDDSDAQVNVESPADDEDRTVGTGTPTDPSGAVDAAPDVGSSESTVGEAADGTDGQEPDVTKPDRTELDVARSDRAEPEGTPSEGPKSRADRSEEVDDDSDDADDETDVLEGADENSDATSFTETSASVGTDADDGREEAPIEDDGDETVLDDGSATTESNEELPGTTDVTRDESTDARGAESTGVTDAGTTDGADVETTDIVAERETNIGDDSATDPTDEGANDDTVEGAVDAGHDPVDSEDVETVDPGDDEPTAVPSRSDYEPAAISFTENWPDREFDYSPESLARLDTFLDDQWEGRFRPGSLEDSPTDPEEASGPLVEVGAYVGEVLVRHYDGEWVLGDDGEAAVAVAGRHGRAETFPVFAATRRSLIHIARIAYEVDAMANRLDVDRTASGAEQTGFALGDGGPGTEASSADVITTLVDRADAFAGAWPSYDLDYRPASLARLDNLVDREFETDSFDDVTLGDRTDADALRLADRAAGASAYFAAVLVRHLDAQWEIDEEVALAVEGPAGETRVRPFQEAVQRLRRGGPFMLRYDWVHDAVRREARVDED